MLEQPPHFFVVGTGRSGTTLTRAILGGHSDVVIPGETGFLPRLLQLRPLWWGPRGLRRDAFIRLAFANGRLTRSGLCREELSKRLDQECISSPLEAIAAIYCAFGVRENARLMGDKTPGYIDSMALLGASFPQARIIQMVRHPLETIGSLVAQPWGPDSIAAAALMWKRSQQRIAKADLADRLLVLRLEDLVADQEAAVSRMAVHLDLEVQDQMFRFTDRAAAIASQNVHPSSHQGLKRPLEHSGGWEGKLNADQAATAWGIVRRTAETLGYEGPDTNNAGTPARAVLDLAAFRARRSARRLETAWRLLEP